MQKDSLVYSKIIHFARESEHIFAFSDCDMLLFIHCLTWSFDFSKFHFAAAGAAAVAAAAVVCKAVAEITILLKLHALKCVSNAFGIFIMEPLFFLSPSIAFFDAS